MQVTEQGLATSRHADRTERGYILLLLLFAVALGCNQREGMWIWAPMISEELRLTFPDVGNVFATFALASTAGFLLMAVFIWRKKSWMGYAVLGILGGLGALLTGLSSGVSGMIVAQGIAGLAYGGLLVGLYRWRLAPTKVSWAGDRTRICADKLHVAAHAAYHHGDCDPHWLALEFTGYGGIVVSVGTPLDLAVSPIWPPFAQ